MFLCSSLFVCILSFCVCVSLFLFVRESIIKSAERERVHNTMKRDASMRLLFLVYPKSRTLPRVMVGSWHPIQSNRVDGSVAPSKFSIKPCPNHEPSINRPSYYHSIALPTESTITGKLFTIAINKCLKVVFCFFFHRWWQHEIKEGAILQRPPNNWQS